MLSKIYLTTIDKNNNRRHYHATSDGFRRIYSRIASADAVKFIIRVVYGKFLDDFRRKVVFDNEAICSDKKDTAETLKTFLEIKPEELG